MTLYGYKDVISIKNFTLTNIQNNWMFLLRSFVALLLSSSFFWGVLCGLFYPFLKRLLVVQRVCKMLYASQFYIVNNFEDMNMMASSDTKLRKDIIYFPRAYVKMKRKKFEFTIQLDGSKFHQAGSYEQLSEALEQRFGVDLVGMLEKNSYFTYEFESDNAKNRISIYDVVPKGSIIPLMKGIFWDIAKTPHALIVGGTGGGKTFFIQVLVRAFALMGADIRIGDPKNSDLADNEKVIEHVYTNTEDISVMIKATVEDMNKRYADIKLLPNYKAGENYTYYGLKPIVLILDEYVAYMTDMPKKAERDVVLNHLRQIILKGRQVGVFGIFGTQRPDATYLAGDIRDQLGLRVSLGAMEDDGYRMAFGSTSQSLRNKDIKGRGYLRMDGLALLKEFYSPFVPKGYDFVGELMSIFNVSGHEFFATAKNSSESENIEQEPTGDWEVREIIHDKVESYERSE